MSSYWQDDDSARSEPSDYSEPSQLAEQVRQLNEMLDDRNWMGDGFLLDDDDDDCDSDECDSEMKLLASYQFEIQQEISAAESMASGNGEDKSLTRASLHSQDDLDDGHRYELSWTSHRSEEGNDGIVSHASHEEVTIRFPSVHSRNGDVSNESSVDPSTSRNTATTTDTISSLGNSTNHHEASTRYFWNDRPPSHEPLADPPDDESLHSILDDTARYHASLVDPPDSFSLRQDPPLKQTVDPQNSLKKTDPSSSHRESTIDPDGVDYPQLRSEQSRKKSSGRDPTSQHSYESRRRKTLEPPPSESPNCVADPLRDPDEKDVQFDSRGTNRRNQLSFDPAMYPGHRLHVDSQDTPTIQNLRRTALEPAAPCVEDSRQDADGDDIRLQASRDTILNKRSNHSLERENYVSTDDPDGVYCDMAACSLYPTNFFASLLPPTNRLSNLTSNRSLPRQNSLQPHVLPSVTSNIARLLESMLVDPEEEQQQKPALKVEPTPHERLPERTVLSSAEKPPSNRTQAGRSESASQADQLHQRKITDRATLRSTSSRQQPPNQLDGHSRRQNTKPNSAASNSNKNVGRKPTLADCQIIQDGSEKFVAALPIHEVAIPIQNQTISGTHTPATTTLFYTKGMDIAAVSKQKSNVPQSEPVLPWDEERSDSKSMECSPRLRFLILAIACLLFCGALVGTVLVYRPFEKQQTINTVAEPANNFCKTASGPIPLNSSLSYGTTLGATIDIVTPCGTAMDLGPGVWFKVIGTNMPITANTCHRSDFDTQIAVYIGDCDNLQCVAGNNDGLWSDCGVHSTVTWMAREDWTYYLLVKGAHGEEAGNFALGIEETVENDLCSTAIGPVATDGKIVFGSTETATPDTAPVCGSVQSNGKGVWYTIIGTGRPILVSTCKGTSFDSQLSVFRGSCEDLQCIDANDDGCRAQSAVTLSTEEGETYYILVHGGGNSAGEFELSISESFDNFLCETATGPVPTRDYSTRGSTSNVNDQSRGVWYWLKGNGRTVSASTCTEEEDSIDTKLELYNGECGNLSFLQRNDDECGQQSTLSWFAEYEEVYFLLVSGEDDVAGPFELHISETAAGNSCESSTVAVSDGDTWPVAIDGSTIGFAAVDDFRLEVCGPLPQSPAFWYSFRGTGTQITLSTCGGTSEFEAVFYVLEGSCDELFCVVGASSSCGSAEGQQFLSWASTEGQAYYIVVFGNTPDETGTFTMNLLGNSGQAPVANVQESSPPGMPAWVYGVIALVIGVSILVLIALRLKKRRVESPQ